MKGSLLRLLLVAAGIVWLPAIAAELPDRLTMVYRATVGGLDIGTITRELRSEGEGHYRVNSETDAKGIARLLLQDTYAEQSRFRVQDGLVIPLSYRQGPENKPEKVRSADFDWDNNVVTLNNGRAYALKPGIQDAGSFLFYWMLKPPQEGHDGTVAIVDGKRMSEYQYQVRGRQTVATAWGDVDTLLVERHKPGEAHKVVRLWIALDRHNLPVRLESVRPNYTMTFDLEKVEGID